MNFLKKAYDIHLCMKPYFGGSHLKRKRKSQRPLDFEKCTHLVLRLKEHLPSLFDPRDQDLRKLFTEIAEKHEIRVYQTVMNHTHVHASLLIPNRKAYVRFVRELCSRLVSYWSDLIGIKLRRVFESRPFSRIVAWGRSYQILNQYLKKNEIESGVQQLVQRKRTQHSSKESSASSKCGSGASLGFSRVSK